MFAKIIASSVMSVFLVSATLAQTPAPSADNQEANCNPTVGKAPSASDKTMAVEKSAILPSAGGHAGSAAPTVQQDGKAMQVRPDCPPDGKTK